MEERPVASWEKDPETAPGEPRCGRCGAATRGTDVRCGVCGAPLLKPTPRPGKEAQRAGR
jgi:hypothetical protein